MITMAIVQTLVQLKVLGFFLSTSHRNVFLPVSSITFKNHHMLRSRGRCMNVLQTSYALFHKSTEDRNENSTDHDLELDSKQLPRLMNEPIDIKHHSLSKGFSYIYKVRDVIKPDFDPEFNVDDFEMGVKHAVFTVSSLLAKGDLESLKELFDPNAHSEVERNLSKFVPDQRLSLPTNPKDFQRCFIYEMETKGDAQDGYIEILTCVHFAKSFSELMGLVPDSGSLKHHRGRGLICNMRFRQNYTRGAQGPWLINFINYFWFP